jgi:hypothetical protein
MRNFKKSLVVIPFLTSLAFSQHLSVGIKAGVPLTDAFADKTQNGVDFLQRTFSDSKEYIIGAMVELRLPLGLSVEADGLYHPLNFAMESRIVTQQVPFRSSNNYSSFEFPILGKYRFPTPLIHPYVEAGPSFRTLGGNFDSYVSHAGFAAGGGIEFQLLKLRIAPEVRYTRWADDGKPSRGVNFLAPSNVNQASFLVGFSF